MIEPQNVPSPLPSSLKRDLTINHQRIVTRGRTLWVIRIFASMFLKALWLKVRGKGNLEEIGDIVRQTLQKLGVLWIKVGQLMAARSDVLPPVICDALARLRDEVEGFPGADAIRAVERNFNRPITEIFSEFNIKPKAGASIAQVHEAILAESGIRVAVKVRRPHIEEVFEKDMRLLRFFATWVQRLFPNNRFRPNDMIWEVEQVLKEEMDYRYEASYHLRMRETFADYADIYVPELFTQWCTREILVQEFIPCPTIEQFIKARIADPIRVDRWARENNIDPHLLGTRLFESFLRQLLEDNLFHGDLHPANMMMMRDSKVVYLDFGSIGSMEGDSHRKYDAYIEGISTGNFAKAVDIFLLIMPDLPSRNLALLKQELIRETQSWAERCRVPDLDYDQKSGSMLLDRTTRTLSKYGVDLYWPFFRILRAWSTLDACLRPLSPRLNMPKTIADYNKKRHKRGMMDSLKKLPRDILRLNKLIDLPREYYEQAIYKGATVRRLAQVFEGTTNRIAQVASQMFRLSAAAFLLLVTLLFGGMGYQHFGWAEYLTRHDALQRFYSSLPAMDWQVWILFLTLLLRIFIDLAGLGKNFAQAEDFDSGGL